MFCDSFIIFDHLHHLIKVVSHTVLDTPVASVEQAYTHAVEAIHEIIARLEDPSTIVQPVDEVPVKENAWSSNVGQSGYETFVKRIKGKIKAFYFNTCRLIRYH